MGGSHGAAGWGRPPAAAVGPLGPKHIYNIMQLIAFAHGEGRVILMQRCPYKFFSSLCFGVISLFVQLGTICYCMVATRSRILRVLWGWEEVWKSSHNSSNIAVFCNFQTSLVEFAWMFNMSLNPKVRTAPMCHPNRHGCTTFT